MELYSTEIELNPKYGTSPLNSDNDFQGIKRVGDGGNPDDHIITVFFISIYVVIVCAILICLVIAIIRCIR